MTAGYTLQQRAVSGTATMASAGSTASFDLGATPRGSGSPWPWRTVYVRVPSLSTNAAMGLEYSLNGSSWSEAQVKSGTAEVGQYILPSATTGWITLQDVPRYFRFHATAAVDDGANFEVVAFD